MQVLRIEPYTPGWGHEVWIGLGALLQGGPREGRQQTRPGGTWRPLTPSEGKLLGPPLRYAGDPKAKPMWCRGIPYFRLPRLSGGWKTTAVMEIRDSDIQEGFLVWQVAGDQAGLSLIPFRRRVRALIGPRPVNFYGFHADGRPLRLQHIALTSIFDERFQGVTLR